jgi:hypothetical protein
MKKIFLFATIAAAGLFASCSSTDDTIGDAQNGGIESIDDSAPQAVKIGIGNVGSMVTRGTGTVGGVTAATGTDDLGGIDGVANKWAGQSINVFMFKKELPANTDDLPANYVTSFTFAKDGNNNDLYNNTEMITPGSAENLIPNMGVGVNVNEGEAMIKGGTIQYYPLSGYYDFFGYHLDDALPTTADPDDYVTTNGDKMTVPFAIDGSQDLMSTKAELTALQTTTMSAATRPADYYSAYSARRGVQPYLTFNHLLTRFAFFVKAGKESAAGLVAAQNGVQTPVTPAEYGNMTAAEQGQCTESSWTLSGTSIAIANVQTLSAELQAYFILNDNNTPADNTDDFYDFDGTKNPITDATVNTALSAVTGVTSTVAGYTWTHDIPAHQDFGKAVKVTSIKVKSKYTGDMAVAWKGAAANLADADKIVWNTSGNDGGVKELILKARPYAKQKAGTTLTHADFPDLNKEYNALDPLDAQLATKQAAIDTRAAERTEITEAMYETLDATIQQGGASEKFLLIDDKVAMNKKLVALDPTPAKWGTTEAELNPVGEALLVGPTDQDDLSYYLEVEVSQDLPTNWNPAQSIDKEQKVISKLRLKAPDANGFLPNTSYNIILTVYSLERIEVIAIVTPWEQAADDVNVGGDE